MELVGWILGVIGSIASIYAVFIGFPHKSSWWSVQNAIKQHTHDIKTDGKIPEIVVLYGRGGAVFGGLLAGNLGNIPVTSIDRSVIESHGITGTKILNPSNLELIKRKNALLVTGEVVTGNQLAKAIRALKKYEPKSVITVSYYVCNTSRAYPNYYYKETKGVIKVPWRMSHTYKHSSKKGVDV